MSHRDPERAREYAQQWRAEHRTELADYRRNYIAEWRSRFARTGELPGEHGLMAYEIGCRCRTCRTTHNEEHKPYDQQRRERERRAKDPNADFDWEGAS